MQGWPLPVSAALPLPAGHCNYWYLVVVLAWRHREFAVPANHATTPAEITRADQQEAARQANPAPAGIDKKRDKAKHLGTWTSQVMRQGIFSSRSKGLL